MMAETNGHGPTVPQGAWRLIVNQLSRLGLASRLGLGYDGDRQMHEVLGYKKQPVYADFKARYIRQGLAHRIVKAYPDATWSQPPALREEEGDQAQTPFEVAWEVLATRLHLYTVLRRVDLLANLGQYAILLLGVRGETNWTQPLARADGAESLLYVTPYSEEFARIHRFETDKSLPTFGLPLLYQLHTGTNQDVTRRALPSVDLVVHASRVLHVAEDLLDDEVYGIPRLEPAYDHLDDVLKIVGGGAEGFWRDARRRLALTVKEGYTLDDTSAEALTQEAEEYAYGFKDFLRLQGVDIAALSGTVASPRDHFDVVMELLSATTGIPKRILLGSERGELSSNQDDEAWKERITQRQRHFAEPRILRPLVDRLIALRILPTPAQPYQVVWDNLFSLSEAQQATIAKDVATALHTYAPGMASAIVPPEQFVTEYLNIEFQGVDDLEVLAPEEGTDVEGDEAPTDGEETDADETDTEAA